MEKKRFQFKEHPWISIAVLLFLYVVTDVLLDVIRQVLKPDVQIIIAQDSVKGAKKEVIKGKGVKGVLTDLRDVAVKGAQLLAAALLIVVLCLLSRWVLSPPEGIVVLSFENKTGIAEYDGMGKGIVDSLIAELQDIGRIHMIKARGPKEVRIMRVEEIELPIMGGGGAVEESLREIGDISAGEVNVPVGSLLATIKTLFTGSGKTISGSIQKYGSTIRIVAKLDENGGKIKAWEVSGPASSGSDLTGLIEELAFKICWDLSENATANSWESLKHFTYGLENSHRYELSERAEDACAYKAIRNYKDAIAIQPGYAIAHYNLGAIYYDLGECGDVEGYHKARCEKAIEEYEKATEANPDFKDAYYNLGVAYYTPFFNRDMAMENYSKVINLDPTYSKAYRNRGAIYKELEEYAKAINDCSHLINLHPNDPETYLLRGLTYRRKVGSEQAEANDLNRAINDFSRAIDLDPNLTEGYYNRGCAYTDLEQYDHAIDDLSHAIALEPSYVEAYSARGVAYIGQDKCDKAVTDFTQAIALDPASSYAYNSRAIAYKRLGDHSKAITEPVKAAEYYGKAIADYTKAIELDPSASFFYYNRGLSYQALWDMEGRNEEDPNRENGILDFENFLELQEDPHWRVKAGDKLRELQGEKTIADLDLEIQGKPHNAEAFYERGIAHFNVGVYKQAIADFDQVIELKSEDARAYLQRGIAYTKLDPPQEEKAIADFEHVVIEINPKETEAYRQRGLIYESQARVHDEAEEFEQAVQAYDKAVADFDEIIKIDRHDAEAFRHRGDDHYHMGQIYARISDDPSEAERRFDLAVKDLTEFMTLTTAITDVVWARNLRGLSCFEVANYSSAIIDFSEAIELQPDAFLYYNRGNVYYRQGKHKEAIADYDEAIQRNPNVADFYYERGSAHELRWKETGSRQSREMAIQDLEKAARLGYDVPEEQFRGLREGEKSIAKLDQIIADNPENADAYYLRGVARAGQSQYQLAIEDFSRVIELKPDQTKAFYNRGLAHSHLGQHQQAVTDFTAAIEQGIEGVEAYRHRGRAHFALKNRIEAIADFDQVIDLEPNDAEAYRLRGTVYSDLGDYDRAIADFTQAISLNPTDINAHYHLGITYMKRMDYSLAFANFNRAIELDPLDARAYNGLGIAYTNLEDYPQAIDCLNKAIKLNPAYDEAYCNRGIVYKLQENNKKAIQDFERALEMTEDLYWQRLAEDQLGELRRQ